MRCLEHYYNPPAQPNEITCDFCLREACDHYTPTEAEEQIVKLRARIKELEETLRARTVDRDARLEQCRRLEADLEAVKVLHAPYGIYDECPHTHTSEDEPGVIDVESVGLTCEEGRLYTVCRVCHCDENGDMREDLDEAGYPCPTRRAAEGKP